MRWTPREAALGLSLALLIAGGAARADEQQPPEQPPATEQVEIQDTGEHAPATQPKSLFRNLYRDTEEFTLVNERPRLSYHKPMYVLPASYSSRYDKSESEFIFQLSLKLQLFKSNFFFGYSQRSYWQIYNEDDSRPFRETNYNPELFYRFKPQYAFCPGCGLDVGIEHESNGRPVPESRSWNRTYLALYREGNNRLLHLRAWYRIPEDKKKTPDDPQGDDNPDIHRYYGHAELRVQQAILDTHIAALMLRGNLDTGKGAVELNYSVPIGDYLYANLYVFNGYGETLMDYDRSLTRAGIGLMLVR